MPPPATPYGRNRNIVAQQPKTWSPPPTLISSTLNPALHNSIAGRCTIHPPFTHQLAALKKFKPRPESENPIDKLLATEFERDMVKVGAPGQLAMEGKLTILPAEDHGAYTAGNVFKDGKYKVEPTAQQRREEAVVRKLM